MAPRPAQPDFSRPLRSEAPRPAVAYRHADEPIGNIERVYSGHLAPDLAVATYRNTHRLLPSRIMAASPRPRPLESGPEALDELTFCANGERYDLYDYLALNSVTGLLVLHQGRVVHETYQRGNASDTCWMSMSVAKSVTSTLAGMAIRDGSIREGLEARVADYVPALKGSAYTDVNLRQLLSMTSGVAWNETYTDPASDRRALLKAQVAQERDATMQVMAALERAAPPGARHNYSTGETQILAELLHHAIEKPLSAYLSEKLWRPYGMEAPASWWLTSPDGIEIGGSGIGATLRDYARFGQFMLEGGRIDGEALLPEGWLEAATRPTTLPEGEPLGYGFMWWTGWTEASRRDLAYSARGIHGQYVYVNPTRELVIVQNAAAPKPQGRMTIEPMALFDAIAARLAEQA